MGLFDSDFFQRPFEGVEALYSIVPGVGQWIANQDSIEAQKAANSANISSARQAEIWSSDEALKQRDFQERMSGSSHQREVSDLKSAGLNPLLSLNSGASTPPGAMGSAFAARSESVGSLYSGISSSARDALSLMQNMSESNSRIELNRSQSKLSKENIDKASADAYIERLKKRILQRFLSSAREWSLPKGNGNDWVNFGEPGYFRQFNEPN